MAGIARLHGQPDLSEPDDDGFLRHCGSGPGSFHTEIHQLSVNGETHIANMSDPQIPAALAPAVKGIVSLNDFRPSKMKRVVHNANRRLPSDRLRIPDRSQGRIHQLRSPDASGPGHDLQS